VKTIAALLVMTLSNASGVILFDTGDPSVNTTAPTGDLAGSGWQFEGVWGGRPGTPIAPNFFITAHHFGFAGTVFTFQGVDYHLVPTGNSNDPYVNFADPFSDLIIWQVVETFPTFAPLYPTGDEVGQRLVVIGRGTQRGTEVTLNGTLRGWNWGAADGAQRWGENFVSAIVPDPSYHELIYATFDQNGLPSEAHLSSGDSGGGVFIEQNGVWKLAAINLGVDDLYTQPSDSGHLVAAIFDARGYYNKLSDGSFVLISGADPVPTGFYSTRISSSLDWIYSAIDPSGDSDGNGVPNLLQYALDLNAAPERGYGAIQGAASGGSVSLTYRKITTAMNLQYQIEQSTDLVSWTAVTPQEQVIDTRGNVQTIKASVPVGSNPNLFLRLRITQS
jgi:hypothetical protein